MRLINRRPTVADRQQASRPSTTVRGTAPMTRRISRRPDCRSKAWLSTFLAASALLSTPSAARAEAVHVLAQATSVDQVLTNIRNWIMGILAGLTVVFLTVGFVRYLFAASDPGELQKAKTAWKSAGWGFGGAALAPLIVEIFKGIVGSGS